MLPKTEDRFRAELEEARKALESQGRKVSVGDRSSDESGISCDFELPYSSLPTIITSKWN